MRLSTLATRLRALGFDVVEHPGWATRGYRGRDLTAVRGVVWHHTATPHRPGQSDYPTAGYIIGGGAYPPWAQVGVGRTGRVHLLAAGLANHAGAGSWTGLTGNSDTVGVEVESPGGPNDLTAQQRAVIPRLARALTEVYDIRPGNHLRHAEWAQPPGRKVDLQGITGPDIRRAAADPTLLTTTGDDMLTAAQAETLARIDAGVGANNAELGRLAAAVRDPSTGLTARVARLQATVDALLARPAIDPDALAADLAGRLRTLPQGTITIDARDIKAVFVEALRERDQRAAGA